MDDTLPDQLARYFQQLLPSFDGENSINARNAVQRFADHFCNASPVGCATLRAAARELPATAAAAQNQSRSRFQQTTMAYEPGDAQKQVGNLNFLRQGRGSQSPL